MNRRVPTAQGGAQWYRRQFGACSPDQPELGFGEPLPGRRAASLGALDPEGLARGVLLPRARTYVRARGDGPHAPPRESGAKVGTRMPVAGLGASMIDSAGQNEAGRYVCSRSAAQLDVAFWP